MRKITFLFLCSVLSLLACQPAATNSGSEKSVTEIKEQGKIRNSDIIRNPVTAEEVKDTVNVAKMEFEELSYDFGTAEEGDIIEHSFKFTNTGKVALIISDARSTCGCTVPDWPKEPIESGNSGVINVRFNTKGKKGNQKKPVTISANTYPTKTIMYIEGKVNSVEGLDEKVASDK